MVLLVVKINFNIFENVILRKYFTLMLIKGMPNYHAPGDGFNELFIKEVLGHH